MIPFLRTVAEELVKEEANFKNVAIILPSRRASVFLKKELSKLIMGPVFAPYISTIEDFLLETLGWEQENNARLIFRLYEVYLKLDLDPKDEFKDFSKWAQTLLADFNEVDRYMVDADQLFNYISDVKRIESWDLDLGEDPHTEMVNNYLKFWEVLPTFYHSFKEALSEDKKVYQGMAYRAMAEDIQSFIPKIKEKYPSMFFVGFSALNKAEEKILGELYEEKIAKFYWDIDEFYFNDPIHEAGKFLRGSKLIKRLKENSDFNGLSKNITDNEKKITIKAVAGDSLQAIAANATVRDYKDDGLQDVAVVLADENLLTPFLNNLAGDISTLNVTMGLPMRYSSVSAFFGHLWEMHIRQELNGRSDVKGNPAFHYQQWDDLLSLPLFRRLERERGDFEKVRKTLRTQNQIFISLSEIESWCSFQTVIPIQLLFQTSALQPSLFCKNVASFSEDLKSIINQESNIDIGMLFSFYKLFGQLSQLFQEYPFTIDLKTAHQFYKELLSSETIDLEGEPLSGLQVMGMLETRTLDFKNVILTSLNEDVLPKGRSQNSFIPFEIKHRFKLPTYLDKDGVFAYHFFRLLQRAENITLIYDAQNKGLGGGEPSRFINQLEYELSKANPRLTIEKQNIATPIKIKETEEVVIEKTPAVMEKLKQLAQKGISPSALIDYINNPLNFYYKRVLGIREIEEVEEVIAYNTQGTIVHELLQKYYSENGKAQQFLSADLEIFKKTEKEIRQDVIQSLEDHGLKNLSVGKNLLVRETLTGMVRNFLSKEKQELEKNGPIKILGLEVEMQSTLKLENGTEVKLKGIADRIDQQNGLPRVIDYKTGAVLSKDLKFKDWEELLIPEAKNKSFQLMMYAWLFMSTQPKHESVSPSIISLRNVKEWPMPLIVENSPQVDGENLTDFGNILTLVLSQMFDPQEPFKEKILSLSDHDL